MYRYRGLGLQQTFWETQFNSLAPLPVLALRHPEQANAVGSGFQAATWLALWVAGCTGLQASPQIGVTGETWGSESSPSTPGACGDEGCGDSWSGPS